MSRNAAIHLVTFVAGAAISLGVSSFVAGSFAGTFGVQRQDVAMALTGGAFAMLLLGVSWLILRREGYGIRALGLSRFQQFGAGFVISAGLFLGVAAVQSAAVGAAWRFQGLDGIRTAALGLPIGLGMMYEAKRNFNRTAEPAPSAVRRSAQGSRRRFVFGWAAVRSGGLALPIGLHLGGNWVQASVAGFGAAPGRALWRIPVSEEDVRVLTQPDLLPQLPYVVAIAMAAALLLSFGAWHRLRSIVATPSGC